MGRRRRVVVDGKIIATTTRVRKGWKTFLVGKDRVKYRRCQGKRTNGTQCGRRALKGKLVCRFHGSGGRKPIHGMQSVKKHEEWAKEVEARAESIDARKVMRKMLATADISLEEASKAGIPPYAMARMLEVGSASGERLMKAEGLLPVEVVPQLMQVVAMLEARNLFDSKNFERHKKEMRNLLVAFYRTGTHVGTIPQDKVAKFIEMARSTAIGREVVVNATTVSE